MADLDLWGGTTHQFLVGRLWTFKEKLRTASGEKRLCSGDFTFASPMLSALRRFHFLGQQELSCNLAQQPRPPPGGSTSLAVMCLAVQLFCD